MKKFTLPVLLFFFIFAIPSSGFGEGKKEGVFKLEDITVKGEAMHNNDMPFTVNIIGAEQIEDLNLHRPLDILEEVPGVEIGNYNQGGVANVFSIRGFTGAGHGSDAAIYVDGIPLNEGESHADGYADANVLIPLELEKLEVHKGPSSALFGNFARGGTLSFLTRKRGVYNKIKTEYGSNDTFDAQGAFGIKFGSSLYNNTAFQYYKTDGYQNNSEWIKTNFSTSFSCDLTEKLDAGISFRFHGSDWDAPGYIPEEQFKSESRSRHQAVNAEDDGGEKEFSSQKLDLGYNFTKNFRLLYWAYSTQQDFTRFAKFGYAAGGQTERNYDRTVYGTGTSLNFDGNLGAFPMNGVLGLEYYYEETDWKRWNTNNRARLEQSQDRKFNIETASLFMQAGMEFSRYFRPQIGLRYDDFDGDYDNRDPGESSFDRDMQNYDNISPKIGFRSLVLDSLDFRAGYSEGFALPDGEAKYDPTVSLDPVEIRQYETGLTFTPIDMLWVDLAVFIIDTDNEIQEDPIGSDYYKNVGETRRKGIELAMKIFPLENLEIFGDVSFFDTEVRKNPDKQLEGKEISGVPENIINLGVKYVFPQGLGGRVKWHHTDESFIDDMNRFEADSYDVVDLSLFYTLHDSKGTEYKINFRVDNLFDEHYSQAVWSGYGTNNYAVSWPRTFWGGITINW